MLDRLRHASRDRLIRAVRDATSAPFAELREDVHRVEERVDGVERRIAGVERRLDTLEAELKGALRSWERRQRRDLFTAVEQDAARSSADFFRRELTHAAAHFAKDDTLRAALEQAPAEGLYLEFGVATGGTLRLIAEHAPAGTVYGFDSFEGLPEHWRAGFGPGAFATDRLPEVPGAELVVGWFDETLPGFLDQHPEPVAFLHLDADLYSSTRTVLAALAPRLRAGTVILFDEYFNYPGWEEHEHRAWTEFVTERRLRFEYLGFTADDEQIAVRLLDAAAEAPGAGHPDTEASLAAPRHG
jgi:predicted O-methyltransferase YrrM